MQAIRPASVLVLAAVLLGCSTTASRATSGQKATCRAASVAFEPTRELAQLAEASDDPQLAEHAPGIRTGDRASFTDLVVECIRLDLYRPPEG